MVAVTGFPLMEFEKLKKQYHVDPSFKALFDEAEVILWEGQRRDFYGNLVETVVSVYHDFRRKYRFRDLASLSAGLRGEDPKRIKGIVISKTKNEEGQPIEGMYYQDPDDLDPEVIIGCRTESRFETQYLQLANHIRKGQGADMMKWLARTTLERRPHALRAGRETITWDGYREAVKQMLGFDPDDAESDMPSVDEGSDPEIDEVDEGLAHGFEGDDDKKRKKKVAKKATADEGAESVPEEESTQAVEADGDSPAAPTTNDDSPDPDPTSFWRDDQSDAQSVTTDISVKEQNTIDRMNASLAKLQNLLRPSRVLACTPETPSEKTFVYNGGRLSDAYRGKKELIPRAEDIADEIDALVSVAQLCVQVNIKSFRTVARADFVNRMEVIVSKMDDEPFLPKYEQALVDHEAIRHRVRLDFDSMLVVLEPWEDEDAFNWKYPRLAAVGFDQDYTRATKATYLWDFFQNTVADMLQKSTSIASLCDLAECLHKWKPENATLYPLMEAALDASILLTCAFAYACKPFPGKYGIDKKKMLKVFESKEKADKDRFIRFRNAVAGLNKMVICPEIIQALKDYWLREAEESIYHDDMKSCLSGLQANLSGFPTIAIQVLALNYATWKAKVRAVKVEHLEKVAVERVQSFSDALATKQNNGTFIDPAELTPVLEVSRKLEMHLPVLKPCIEVLTKCSNNATKYFYHNELKSVLESWESNPEDALKRAQKLLQEPRLEVSEESLLNFFVSWCTDVSTHAKTVVAFDDLDFLKLQIAADVLEMVPASSRLAEPFCIFLHFHDCSISLQTAIKKKGEEDKTEYYAIMSKLKADLFRLGDDLSKDTLSEFSCLDSLKKARADLIDEVKSYNCSQVDRPRQTLLSHVSLLTNLVNSDTQGLCWKSKLPDSVAEGGEGEDAMLLSDMIKLYQEHLEPISPAKLKEYYQNVTKATSETVLGARWWWWGLRNLNSTRIDYYRFEPKLRWVGAHGAHADMK